MLFHTSQEFFKKYNISIESEIIFSDYCQDLLFPFKERIKFTSKALLFYTSKEGYENINNEWYEVKHVEFHPWSNIIKIQNLKNGKVKQEYDEKYIQNWLKTIEDPSINFPFVNAKKGNIDFLFLGRPKSIRSKGGKADFKRQIESIKDEIFAINAKPFKGNVEMNINVFSTNIESNDLPDIDRFSTLIMDSFKDIAYDDDKQIRELRPRIIDVSNVFNELKCQTQPINLFEIYDIKVGLLYPLAIGVKEYYTVSIVFYN